MTTLTKRIHNTETGEVLDVELTAKEVAELTYEAELTAEKKAEEDVQATAKAALFKKLGITADEAKLLLA